MLSDTILGKHKGHRQVTLIDVIQNNAVFLYGVVAFLGLVVGSFLNVVIHRLPIMMENDWRRACQELDCDDVASLPAQEKYNLAVPASTCPGCSAAIKPWQNIPILSYLLLLGRCANCKQKISLRYPLVELVTCLLSMAVAWRYGLSVQLVAGLLLTWCFVALTMIDFDHQLLPDSITLPLMWLGLLASLLPVFASTTDAVIGAAAGYMVLWSIYYLFLLLTGKQGMGFGDFKLLAAIGAWFGWQMLPMVILLSSLCGAVVGLMLIFFKGRSKEVPIPFGPYLAAAGWITLLFGEQLKSSYGFMLF